jgi:excisionase family DNA binding protein
VKLPRSPPHVQVSGTGTTRTFLQSQNSDDIRLRFFVEASVILVSTKSRRPVFGFCAKSYFVSRARSERAVARKQRGPAPDCVRTGNGPFARFAPKSARYVSLVESETKPTKGTTVTTTTQTKELRPAEVAELLQVSTQTIGRWVSQGVLHPSSTTVGGHRRFHPIVVEHLRRQLQAGR